MKELYRALINDRADRFAELFQHLIDSDAPSVFHCTAGKDRTGIAAALVLLALGVSRDVVVADYLLTNELVRDPALIASTTPLEARAVLWRVQQAFLETALAIIDADHGGIDRYLTQRLRLTPAALRALAGRYLQPSGIG
jgi:protein-tyrosine phosphatase